MWKASPNISWLLILSTATSAATAFDLLGLGNTVTTIVEDVKTEGSAVVTPVVKVVTAVGDGLCGVVADILIDEDKEPDLSKLKLVYRSPELNLDFDLATAAELIPEQVPCYSCDRNLVIFQHGFVDNPSSQNFVGLNTALQSIGECVLAMDASYLLSTGDYISSATRYSKFIGYAMGNVMAALDKECQATSDQNNIMRTENQIHCIGHSLGAHICGNAGKKFYIERESLIMRVTGLDPSGPCYGNIQNETKLAMTDAEFVDVIHTNKGVFGIDEVLGHADFFPNFGEQQPGCLTQTCSHERVTQLEVESVLDPEEFIGIACGSDNDFRQGNCDENNMSKMGYFCPPTARGTFYLQTDSKSPYGLGDAGTKYVNNEGIIGNLGNLLGL